MRIAVVYPSPFLDSTPCLYHLVQGLASEGHELEVFTGEDEAYTKPRFAGSVETHFHSGSRRGFLLWLNGLLSGRARSFDAVIAMDRLGLLCAAAVLRGRRRPPLVYFNVELYLPPIFTGWKHAAANRAEAWLVRRLARLSLAPSRERAAHLAQWYGLGERKVMVIPNAPPGRPTTKRGDYLFKKYQIEEHRPLVLYFGSLTSANRIEEILSSARKNWPEEFTLVLHGRQKADAEGRRWFEEQARGAKCRIILSLDPLPGAELYEMVRSADLGLALYPTDGAGFESMGTASGKIAQYLQGGVPVLTSTVPSLRALFERHPAAGASLNSADEIPNVAERFLADRATGRNAAARCFEEEFSFDNAFKEFLCRFNASLEDSASEKNKK